jgi:hypothetical protein
MGCRRGITLPPIQSSISAWLSDATGGVRVVLGLRGFAIARPPLWPNFQRLTRARAPSRVQSRVERQQCADFKPFLEAIGPFYDDIEEVKHYQVMATG